MPVYKLQTQMVKSGPIRELNGFFCVYFPSVLGSVMAVGPTLLPIFEQLGIYEEFLTIGKYLTHTQIYKEGMGPYRPTDHRPCEEL